VTTHLVNEFARDVRAGLNKKGQKELPSKYLYDDVGSALFEAICVLPEYGLMRADQRLVRRHAGELAERMALPVMVAELGSGNGRKTRWILEELSRRQPILYHPIDVSAAALRRCQTEMEHLDSVRVVGLQRSYLPGLREVVAGRPPDTHLLVLFLGSTIGNFERPAAQEFIREVRGTLRPGDGFLLSADLEKSTRQLMLAYDDPLGVTAAFNLNLLARINRELEADFDLSQFQHLARYHARERRIEMHLCSTIEQTITIGKADLTVPLRREETIWTESSHKFNPQEVIQLGERGGFRCEAQWIDEEWPFTQTLFIAQ
jgi:dimethylhistidine N-methyltransferase